MPLNLGILIIGSLLWDSDRDRPAWRDGRLDMASAQTVTAPIRYGRLSSRRGNTYTMVFSRSCEAGHAKVVRCKRSVSTAADLIAEAQALWKAEQPSAAPGRIAADWGRVALLCNPGRTIPLELFEGWARRVADEPNYGSVRQAPEEGRLITKDGLLQIDWPRLVEGGEALQFDFMLAAANDPKLTGEPPTYPSAATIADAWNRAGEHVEYFWKDRDSGIQTFQDDEIRVLLRPRGQAQT